MIPYKDYAPTQLDAKGLVLSDRHHWLVVPFSQSRDSDCLTQSNFAFAQDALVKLDPEGTNWEIHCFNHWACGWLEIIIISPSDTRAVTVIENLIDRYADYPVLDESDYSSREFKAAHRYWSTCGLRERVSICQRFQASVFAARRTDEIPERIEISYLAE